MYSFDQKQKLRTALSLLLILCASSCSEQKNLLLVPDDLETLTQLTDKDSLYPFKPNTNTCACDLMIPPEQSIVDGENIPAGSTLCFDSSQSNQRGPIQLLNLKGTAQDPIYIRNCSAGYHIDSNDQQAAIRLSGSYFRLSGLNDLAAQSLILNAASSPHTIAVGEAHHFEIDHVNIQSSHFAGIMAKVDPSSTDCQVKDRRYDDFIMKTLYIHHNIIDQTDGEGIYIGNSFFTGISTQYCGANAQCDLNACGGIQYPHLVKDVHVYNNIISNTQWDGIQVGSAVEDCFIQNNQILNGSLANQSSQNHAIQVGDGSSCQVTGNLIDQGGIGIHLAGIGDSLIENNIIRNFTEYGVIINPKPAPLDLDLNGQLYKGGFNISHNTIVSQNNTGPAIRDVNVPNNPVPTTANRIENNIIFSNATDFQLTDRYSWDIDNNQLF